MAGLQAIVFDLDGLMVDSEPLAQRAWEEVLQTYGRSLDESTFNRMIGLRLEESAQLVQATLKLPVGPEVLVRQERAFMSEIVANGVPPMAGLDRLMAEIGRRKIPWAVATSSRRSYAEEVLDQLGLLPACQAIAAGDEVRQAKPAPEIYLLAAKRLAVPTHRCLALEDSVPGGQAAVAAGMVTIAVPGDHAGPADFPFVDHVFDSLYDVAANLGDLFG